MFKSQRGTQPISEKHWICTLHSKTNSMHKEYVAIGKNTGNIMKHADRFHGVSVFFFCNLLSSHLSL